MNGEADWVQHIAGGLHWSPTVHLFSHLLRAGQERGAAGALKCLSSPPAAHAQPSLAPDLPP